MHDFHYLHQHLDVISNGEMQTLFNEIHELRQEPREGMVVHFLTQSLHSPVSGKRRPFDKHEFLLQYYLLRKVKELKDTEIFKLCIDLVAISGKRHIEDHLGSTLFLFFNRTVPDMNKKTAKRK